MTNRLHAWTEPADQVVGMKQSLQSVRNALTADKQYRAARPEITEPLLREVDVWIKQAAAMLERNPELKGDSFVAFKAITRLVFRSLQMALHDPAVALGTDKWLHLVEAGKKGAAALHGDGTAIHELYERYAKRSDGLGDLSKPGELFWSFVGDCDEAGIKPPIQKTFGNQLRLVRKNLGLK